MFRSTVNALLAAVPDVSPTEPPGADKLTTILGWVLWVATAACVAAVIAAGIKIAMGGSGRGAGGEHGMSLLFALAGTIVCGVAASAVTLLF
ncbi:hypothetical protein ACVBEQ_10245 [Nakamurella sp. GG22]